MINIVLFIIAIIMLLYEPSVSLFIFGIMIYFIYWVLKKRECIVCNGRGKVYFKYIGVKIMKKIIVFILISLLMLTSGCDILYKDIKSSLQTDITDTLHIEIDNSAQNDTTIVNIIDVLQFLNKDMQNVIDQLGEPVMDYVPGVYDYLMYNTLSVFPDPETGIITAFEIYTYSENPKNLYSAASVKTGMKLSEIRKILGQGDEYNVDIEDGTEFCMDYIMDDGVNQWQMLLYSEDFRSPVYHIYVQAIMPEGTEVTNNIENDVNTYSCKIILERETKWGGALISYEVFIDKVKLGEIKNGSVERYYIDLTEGEYTLYIKWGLVKSNKIKINVKDNDEYIYIYSCETKDTWGIDLWERHDIDLDALN